MGEKKRGLSLICSLHYVKLVYRAALFVLALTMHAIGRARDSEGLFLGYEKEFWLLALIWIVYAVEMACRFFPSRLESMGCQKQFKRNYRPTGETVPQLQSWKRTFAVAAVWVLLNAAIGALYVAGWIDRGILILVSLAYGVCDMICILFFCPFQVWFMKNRCCAVCRIYNWDFAMMFTPLVFIPGLYARSLLVMSLVLLARWEIGVRRHPERFSVRTNAALSCANCQEKLCHHKRQLQRFWQNGMACAAKGAAPERNG